MLPAVMAACRAAAGVARIKRSECMKRSFWLAAGGVGGLQPARMGPAGRRRPAEGRAAAAAGDHRPAAQAARRSREEAGADGHERRAQAGGADAAGSRRIRARVAAQPREPERLLQFPLSADESPGRRSPSSSTISACSSGKQLRKFNFHMELELQNVPHHPEIHGEEEEGEGEEGEHVEGTDVSGEGQVAVENAWMEYAHNRLPERPRRQAALARSTGGRITIRT